MADTWPANEGRGHHNPLPLREGAGGGVDCRAGQVFAWTAAQEHVMVVQQQMPVRNRHIDAPLLDDFAVFAGCCQQSSRAARWLEAPICRTTKIAAGRSAGRSCITRRYASPPPEAPITMMSHFRTMMPFLRRRFSVIYGGTWTDHGKGADW